MFKWLKSLFTCKCDHCASKRAYPSFCKNTHPAIKLAHHRAEVKTKSYIAHVKKGQV